MSCHCPVTVLSRYLLRSLAAPSASSRISAEILAKAHIFPVGTQTFPHTSINNLARCKVAYAGAGVGWALKGIYAPGVEGHQGNPRNCVRLLMALNIGVGDCRFYLSTPQWLFGPFRAVFSKSKCGTQMFSGKLDLNSHWGGAKVKISVAVSRRPTHWWGRTCREMQGKRRGEDAEGAEGA